MGKIKARAHVIYRGYSQEQIEDLSNGCGGQGLAKFIKPPHAKFFKRDCDKHDIDYVIGGNESDRKKADIALKRRMVKRIKYTHKRFLIEEMYTSECGIPNWLIKILPRAIILKVFYLWALFYYKAVSLAGRAFFNYHS